MAEEYQKARKLGQREVAQRLRQHLPPYLPALDETVESPDTMERVSLGMMSIPISKIVGTVTRQRASAFAANFMPLLDPDSEFGVKWRLLCESVAEMGVCQPIQAFEYLNRFYVLEGNKRVSVSRYLGAVFIEGEVRRILPRESDTSPEVMLYREYLPFLQDTGINRLWFTKSGSVTRLYELLGKTPGEKWSDDDRAAFLSAYTFFRRNYKEVFGDRFEITTGDAFLVFLAVFGWEGASDTREDLRRDRIRLLQREFQLEQEGKGVQLIMQPPSGAGTPGGSPLFHSLRTPQILKAAFLYSLPPEDSGWNFWHEQGRTKLEEELSERIETEAFVSSNPAEWEREIESMVANGYDLIFTTSPSMLEACIRPSVEHPQVKIMNCSLLASYHTVRCYYLRFHEIKFLMGMAAAAMSPGDQLGYVADYPIFGVPAGINAFALGARMVNPRAKVILRWSCSSDFDADTPFRGENITVISGRDVRAPSQMSQRRGLYRLTGEGAERLLSPVLDWSRIYRSMAVSLLSGQWESGGAGTRARDYWWGLSSGALDLFLQPAVEPYVGRLLRHFREQVASGNMRIFAGPLTDLSGVERCAAGANLSPADVLTMDWLLDNVEGAIPSEEDIRPESRGLVKLQGINVIQKPDLGSFSWNADRTGV